MELASVFKRYAAEGTGQLALKFSETSHLCKVDIEDGEAVFIKLGILSPDDTLLAISGKILLEASFIKGYKARKRLPEPITAMLVGDAVVSESARAAILPSTQSTVAAGQSVSAQNVSKMINHYVDIVGPLGVVMMENYIKKISYVQGNEMNSNDYNELVEKVINDLPEPFRDNFQKMHR